MCEKQIHNFPSLLSCLIHDMHLVLVFAQGSMHTQSQDEGEKKTLPHTRTHDGEGPPDKLTWSQQGLFDQRHEAKWALGVNCLCNAPDLQWRERKKKEIPTLFHTYVHLRKINGSRSRNKWEKVAVRYKHTDLERIEHVEMIIQYLVRNQTGHDLLITSLTGSLFVFYRQTN